MNRMLALAVAIAMSVGCAGMKYYTLPVSPYEGSQLVPALIASSESLGLRSYRGPSGAVTETLDGTQLSWQDSADHRSFILLLMLPDHVTEAERESRWSAAKQQADQIWNMAVATRTQLMPAMGPVPVLVQPQPLPPQNGTQVQVSVPGISFSVNSTESATLVAPTNVQQGCRVDFDCPSGGWACRNRGDGYSVCMANGPPGAFCASSGDCAMGLTCRQTGSVNTCQR